MSLAKVLNSDSQDPQKSKGPGMRVKFDPYEANLTTLTTASGNNRIALSRSTITSGEGEGKRGQTPNLKHANLSIHIAGFNSWLRCVTDAGAGTSSHRSKHSRRTLFSEPDRRFGFSVTGNLPRTPFPPTPQRYGNLDRTDLSVARGR
ncbi:hypothetical protein Dda_5534 [Drechslerella dactyloides]|uniref:Uncharacterized protein n=1 Tax=Drechslerella dactyloides TaxID=74499 RepID=A0AAD6IYH2_DREDA|nr:hypothetical protein Dda_5534 [Drechslerella dactyloides]